MIAGADEAGCGTLIGELVAAAVLLPDGFDATGVKDSKKLSPKKREALCARIRAHAHCVGVGVVTIEELNTASFGELRKAVFERAVKDLLRQVTPARIIIDGSGFFDGVDDIPFECVVKADDKYACVSAASIVAKTVRDGLVARLCEEEPDDAPSMIGSRIRGTRQDDTSTRFVSTASLAFIGQSSGPAWRRRRRRTPLDQPCAWPSEPLPSNERKKPGVAASMFCFSWDTGCASSAPSFDRRKGRRTDLSTCT